VCACVRVYVCASASECARVCAYVLVRASMRANILHHNIASIKAQSHMHTQAYTLI